MGDRTNLGLVRVERETIQERVYAALRDKLMRGGFAPGQKLKIESLADAFGTSAMPVREALNRLTAERALEMLPSRTVRVPALSKECLRDLKETRFAVEGLAVARAASNMTDATLKILQQLIDAQSRTDTSHVSEGSAEQNRAFHFTIYRQSGSTVLLPIIEASGFSSALISAKPRSGSMVARGAAPTSMSRSSPRWRKATPEPRALRWKRISGEPSIL